MRTVIVPARAGVFSAVGLLCAPEQRELVRVVADTVVARPASTKPAPRWRRRVAVLVPGGDVDQWVDCRYAGQSHELIVADVDEFPAVHAQRNGYTRPGVDVEVVALRARVVARGAARGRRISLSRRGPRRGDRRSSPSSTARCGCPTAGPPTPGPAGRVDRARRAMNPAELQILGSRLASVADEMGTVLRRAASSPNIKERADCSAALFTADGELLAQAEHIPVHLGSMPASVAAAIATGLRQATRSCSTIRSPAAPT